MLPWSCHLQVGVDFLQVFFKEFALDVLGDEVNRDLSNTHELLLYMTPGGESAIETDRVLRATRNDDIRVFLSRLDKLVVGGLDVDLVLLENPVDRPASLDDVSFQPPEEPYVPIELNENLEVAQVTNLSQGRREWLARASGAGCEVPFFRGR